MPANDAANAADAVPSPDSAPGADAQPRADATPGLDAPPGEDAPPSARDATSAPDAPDSALPAPDVIARDATGPDGATAADASPGGDAAATDGGGTELVLTNVAESCRAGNSVGPEPEEVGQWYAVRLTPPSYPFVVTRVRYQLMGNDRCDATLAHRVRVFTGTATTPPATPAVLAMASVGSAGTPTTPRTVTVDLPSPVRLAAGEQLFVALEMVAQSFCVGLCTSGGAGERTRDWWSNAVDAPFAWATLASFGITSPAIVQAVGHAE